MQLIDTHAHLYLDNFTKDIDSIILRARDKNIKKIVLPNIDSGTINSLKKLSEDYPSICIPLMGLHPTSVKDNYIEELKIVTHELKNGKYCGVGETGIDLYWDKTFFNEQKIAFQNQIEWSLEMNLPLIIHARDSFNEIFNILKNYKNENLKGIFHSFTGTVDEAHYIINNFNLKIGIGGIVTFKNAGLDKVVQAIPLKHIVLETDAPFLAPVPNRGKRNESSYLVYTAEKIAQIHKLNFKKVADITTNNALEILNLNE